MSQTYKPLKITLSLLAGAVIIGAATIAVAGDDWRKGHCGYGMHKAGYMHHGGMGQGKGMRLMQRFDTDNDGKVAIAEVETMRRATFQTFDANRDGQLNLAEFKALWTEHNQDRMTRRFQKFDDNADGIISEDDFIQPMTWKLNMMDRNGDGVISKDDRRRKYRDDDDD